MEIWLELKPAFPDLDFYHWFKAADDLKNWISHLSKFASKLIKWKTKSLSFYFS